MFQLMALTDILVGVLLPSADTRDGHGDSLGWLPSDMNTSCRIYPQLHVLCRGPKEIAVLVALKRKVLSTCSEVLMIFTVLDMSWSLWNVFLN